MHLFNSFHLGNTQIVVLSSPITTIIRFQDSIYIAETKAKFVFFFFNFNCLIYFYKITSKHKYEFFKSKLNRSLKIF